MKSFLHTAISLALTRGLAFVAAAALGPAMASAAHADIKLPPVTAKLRPSPLVGYTVATQKCAICHSADYVNYQPPGMTLPQWTAEMAKMQHAYGAPIDETEIKQIGAYLAVAYGSAKATDPDVVAASAQPKPASGAAAAKPDAAIDVQAVLASNACLGCHALAQKIVGPAYRDVAAKYKGDAQALVKLQTSIRAGGVGKWGQVPMPPFAALTDAQVKALAEFVLKQ